MFFNHPGEQLVWFMAHKENSGTRLTLGMCSGAQWRGGGGTGHYRLLRAHAGPRGRWRQTGQPPHKASNQSAPIHRRWHRDPIGRMGVGNQGQNTLGVRSAQSRLPVDRIWFNINPAACLSLSSSPQCQNCNTWSHIKQMWAAPQRGQKLSVGLCVCLLFWRKSVSNDETVPTKKT